jgi:hypothetical protein
MNARLLRRRAGTAVLAVTMLGAGPASAASVLPLNVMVPGAPSDPALLDRLAAECRRRGFLPVAPIDVAGPPPPRAAAALDRAVRSIGELHLAEAVEQLDLAAADAVLTGGAGLTAAQLADVYFYRAIALQKLDPADTSRFWDDYVRAATLLPERVLDPGRFAPAAVESWRRAAAAVQRGARGTLVVRAPADAKISVDAHAPLRPPALLPGLPQGEHLVRVEQPGRWPWAIVVRLAAPTLEMDVPVPAPLALDDATAAAAAQHRGAAYALVAQRRAGPERVLDLRLVDAGTRLARGTAVAGDAPGALEAAVTRLMPATDGAPAAALTGSVPAAPSRRLVPWLIVAGAAVAGVAAGILVGVELSREPARPGFSATADLGRARP